MIQKLDIKELCVVPPPVGGVSVYCRNLYEKLSSDGYKVGAYYSKSNCEKDIRESELFDELDWEHSGNPLISLWRHVVRYFHILHSVRPYKVVHSHFGLEEMFTIWSIKYILGKDLIISIHNSMVDEFYRQSFFFNKFFLRLLAGSDVNWICVNEKGKRQLLNLPFKFKTEISVIPPYIPRPYEKAGLPESLCTYINNHDKCLVFYAHSFMTYNGMDVYGFQTALDTYSKLKHTNSGSSLGMIFCLAETSDSAKIRELHRQAEEMGINESIFWQIGAIDNMNELWKAIDIYIRPTATDGDSLAVREALDAGAQVVASDVCERPDNVITYHYRDDNEFLQKIKEALTMERGDSLPNLDYYNSVKRIYDKYLSK